MSEREARLIQVFLSQKSGVPGPGIFEVSGDEDQNFFCTCPGYIARRSCKHIKFVQARILENGGTYPLELSTKATNEEASKAMESTDEFRKFILKYGKIEIF